MICDRCSINIAEPEPIYSFSAGVERTLIKYINKSYCLTEFNRCSGCQEDMKFEGYDIIAVKEFKRRKKELETPHTCIGAVVCSECLKNPKDLVDF